MMRYNWNRRAAIGCVIFATALWLFVVGMAYHAMHSFPTPLAIVAGVALLPIFVLGGFQPRKDE